MTNQNFRVKKGLEVGLGGTYLYADDTGVGIGSALPRVDLDVRGEAYIENLEVGPGAAVTDLIVNGDSYFDGDVYIGGDLAFEDADLTNLKVSGIATINQLEFNSGVGTDLGVTGLLTANNLEVSGITSLSNTFIDGALGVTSSVGIAKTLFVGGDVQIGGGITFKGDIDVEVDVNLEVAGNINATGISTFNELRFNVGIGSTLTVEDLFVTGDIDVNGTGIATIGGDPQFNSLSVTGFSTFGGLNTTGFSTFYQNVRIEQDLEVGGDITLLDLEAGNITVGGTVFTEGLDFKVGIGSTLTVGILSVTEDIKVNGSGIATLGGDPDFNSLSVTGFSTFGGLNTTGFSTFYQNVRITEDLFVGGNITLDDLTSGNISVGGTLTTNGLEFNSGVGTSLIVGFTSITDATIGVATVGEVNVTGFATFGGLNTTGFSTFYQNLEVTGDLRVGGDINLEDLNADSISIGNTVTTDDLRFNVGIGTSLVITGISSLNIITGIGSELQYLPAGSISTSVGIGSTIPPANRPTGEPVQAGDLWFDSEGKRQYTYYVGLNTLGAYEGQWVDSNPPPVQPLFRFDADTGITGQVDISTQTFSVSGTDDQIITRNTDAIIGAGRTVNIGLTTNISLEGSVSAGTTFIGAAASISGVGSFGYIFAPDGEITNLTIGGITVDDITAGNINIVDLRFNSGVGTDLEVEFLNVTGIATINGAGIATLGGSAEFDDLQVIGVSTFIGVVTTRTDVYVGGDLYVADDLVLDEATLRNLTVSERAGITTLNYGVGIGSTLTVVDKVSIGGTLGVSDKAYLSDDVSIGGKLDVVGVVSVTEAIQGKSLAVTESVDVLEGTITGKIITSSESLGFVDANGTNMTVSGTLNATGEVQLGNTGIQTATITNTLEVASTGIGSFIGTHYFTKSEGYELTVSTLTAGGIDIDGGTGIGSDRIETQFLNVSGVSTFVGLSTFKGDVFIADDLEVKRDLLVGGAATVGVLTAGDTVLTNLIVTGNLSGSSGGTIIIDGGTNISGIVTIGDNSITLDGRQGREYIELGTGSGNRIAGVNTLTGERSYVSVDEGRFNNFISVAGVGSTSTFANDVFVGGDLTIVGDVSFDGGTGIGSTTITTGDIDADTITVGFITATNAYAGIITAQDFNSLSDRRVKENIRPIEQPLDKVSRLNGVKYNFVNSNKPSVGVIAQEVEKVFPELIAGTFPKSVNYNGLTGLLIEAVKELKEQNEELKRRLDKLEG